MKKYICLILSITMLLALTACGSNQEDEGTNNTSPPEISTEDTNTGTSDVESEDKDGETGKILIAYFTAAENSDVDAVSSASVVTVDGVAKGCL